MMDQMLVVLRSIDQASPRTAVAVESLSRHFLGLADAERKAAGAGDGLARTMPRVRDEVEKTSKSALVARTSLGQFGDGLVARFLGVTAVFQAARAGLNSFTTLYDTQMAAYTKNLDQKGKANLRTGELRRDLALLGVSGTETETLTTEIDAARGGGAPGQARQFALTIAETEARRRGSDSSSIAAAVRAGLADFQAQQLGEITGSAEIYQRLQDADPEGRQFDRRGELAAALAIQQRRLSDDDFTRLMNGLTSGQLAVGASGRLIGYGAEQDLVQTINERGGLSMQSRPYVSAIIGDPRFSGASTTMTEDGISIGGFANPALASARTAQWEAWVRENVPDFVRAPPPPTKSQVQRFVENPLLYSYDTAMGAMNAVPKVASGMGKAFMKFVPFSDENLEMNARADRTQGLRRQLELNAEPSIAYPDAALQKKMDAFFSGKVAIPVKPVMSDSAQETQ
jgi:hypothetical protein